MFRGDINIAHHLLCFSCRQSQRMRWCLCGRSRCLADVLDYILSVKDDGHNEDESNIQAI